MPAYWDITSVTLIGEYAIHVTFFDGLEGDVHFEPGFFRGVFSHLVEPRLFNQVRVIDGVVTWPGNLDLAPDAMYDEIKQHGMWSVKD